MHFQVVGDKVFDRKEKDRLIKTRAFVNEMLRYASIGESIEMYSLGVSHSL